MGTLKAHVTLALLLRVVEGMGVKKGPDELAANVLDSEFEVRAGDYVWRPAGNRHLARSPEGALVLSFFLKPNRFLEGPSAGKNLE